ncbi:hypothetical protein PIB30_036285 [Stylosanthes scabra]|uniref:Uncharacterized protein n=1 Tax=Stylosanthes scabra TaxID=79078 RepID=A0ABU6QCZ9_9FABA|nr:hypothetical protein [Stylosanthes scabra]
MFRPTLTLTVTLPSSESLSTISPSLLVLSLSVDGAEYGLRLSPEPTSSPVTLILVMLLLSRCHSPFYTTGRRCLLSSLSVKPLTGLSLLKLLDLLP